MSKIFDINAIPEGYLPLVGGKAKGLYELIRFGFNVPKAFIVTDMSEGEDFAEAARAYEASGMDEVSVRSSATLEDGKDFSAAGQFSTFLNIRGTDKVIAAVRDCEASLRNDTVLHYSKVFLRSADCRMTAIVQKMVKAKCAGVLFTKAPMRSGFVLVEAVPGLGENLVSGKMSAQQYRIRDNMVENMPDNPLLTKDQAIALCKAGKKAEKLFGLPLDMEWAIDENDRIHWLQARPITIGESVTMNELDCDLDSTNTVYTTGNIGEVMPGAVTPLTLSTNMYSLDWAVMKTFVEIGCYTEQQPPYTFIAPFYNHMFFNMTSLYRAGHCVPLCDKDSTDVSICGKVLEGMPDCDMPNAGFFAKMRNTVPFLKLLMGGESAKKGMAKVVANLHFNLDTDKDALYAQILDNFIYMKQAHYFHYGASYYSGGTSALLSGILARDFKNQDELASLIAGSLTQIEDFESADILRSMKDLAALMVKEYPSIVDATVDEILDYFDNTAGEKVREAEARFMERHGYRGILENELMNLPWRDNRISFCTSIKSVLSSGQEEQKSDMSWEGYAETILCRYKGLKRKLILKSILKARKGVCYREFTKSRVIYVVDQFKQAYRRLAKMMVEDKLLPDVDCIYFLTQDEVGRLLKGEQALVKKALARRRLYPQQKELRFPYAVLGIPQPLSAVVSNPNAKTFQGTPVSRGVASGIARVVNDEKDASLLQKGEIMVTGCVDIGWSPYYSIIGGLVTEIGSALSHGVVVAREYALPTVVNVDNIRQLIKTGDRITIDGNTGSVVIDD